MAPRRLQRRGDGAHVGHRADPNALGRGHVEPRLLVAGELAHVADRRVGGEVIEVDRLPGDAAVERAVQTVTAGRRVVDRRDLVVGEDVERDRIGRDAVAGQRPRHTGVGRAVDTVRRCRPDEVGEVAEPPDRRARWHAVVVKRRQPRVAAVGAAKDAFGDRSREPRGADRDHRLHRGVEVARVRGVLLRSLGERSPCRATDRRREDPEVGSRVDLRPRDVEREDVAGARRQRPHLAPTCAGVEAAPDAVALGPGEDRRLRGAGGEGPDPARGAGQAGKARPQAQPGVGGRGGERHGAEDGEEGGGEARVAARSGSGHGRAP